MAKEKHRVSLLPGGDFQNSLSGRAIGWVTSTGRYTVVFVEFLVIMAFLSRFWLDRKNSDLSELIRQQKAIIESVGEFEDDYRRLQREFLVIDKMLKTKFNSSDTLALVTDLAPQDLVFNNLSLSNIEKERTVQFTVEILTEQSLISFINSLAQNSKVSSVNISSIKKEIKNNKYEVSGQVLFKQ